MKKLLTAFLSIILCASVLSGCAGENKNAAKATNAPEITAGSTQNATDDPHLSIDNTIASLCEQYNTNLYWQDCLFDKNVLLFSEKTIYVAVILLDTTTVTVIPTSSVSSIQQNVVQEVTFLTITENSGNATSISLKTADAQAFMKVYESAK